MAGEVLPLTGDEFVARLGTAPPSTSDDVSVTRDGRRLGSKAAVLAWLAEVELDRAGGLPGDFDAD